MQKFSCRFPNFFCPDFPYVFFLRRLECLAFQILCPMLHFQSLEIFPVVPVFFSEKGGKSGAKSCSIRTALRPFCMRHFFFLRLQTDIFLLSS